MQTTWRRFSAFFLGALLLVFIPGCLDIEEEIFMNADGSGTYATHIDLSGMMDMILMMAPDSVKDQMGDNPDAFLDSMFNSQETASSFATVVDDYNLMAGISNTSYDILDGVMTIKYDFSDVAALSAALKSGNQGTNQLGIVPPAFTGKKGKLSRAQSGDGFEAEMDPELESQMDMMKMMMGDATYTTRYHFPGQVKKAGNKDATITDGGKTVVLEVKLLDVLDDPSILNNDITFKKK
ncbi:MAG: hypothetical protein NWR72_21370 [Bacteroidia bacterium]|nr:hypothetical protein [Bacteroidia bacterium]